MKLRLFTFAAAASLLLAYEGDRIGAMARARPFFRFLAGLLAAAGMCSLVLMMREGPDDGKIAEPLRPWIGVLMFSLTAAMSYVAATGRWPWRLPDETHD